MSHTLFLDSTPLSEATRPPGQSAEANDLKRWVLLQVAGGSILYVSEIADYEVRRELNRAGRTASLTRLDAFIATAVYLPITTQAMRLASQLWAQARNNGWVTADPKALDADVILAAQALTLTPIPTNLVVVTENVAHLSRYVPAQTWRTIT